MKKIVSFSQEIPIAMIMCPPTTQTDLTLTDAGINLTMSSQAFGCAINKALASLPSILLSRRYLLTLVYYVVFCLILGGIKQIAATTEQTGIQRTTMVRRAMGTATDWSWCGSGAADSRSRVASTGHQTRKRS